MVVPDHSLTYPMEREKKYLTCLIFVLTWFGLATRSLVFPEVPKDEGWMLTRAEDLSCEEDWDLEREYGIRSVIPDSDYESDISEF